MNKFLFFSKELSIIDSLKMLDIRGGICHGKVIHALIKFNMGYQLDSVGIKSIVEQISGGMYIISKWDSFGDIGPRLGLFISRVLYIDTTSEALKGGEVLSLGYIFLNQIIHCIRFLKGIWKLYSMVQGIWKFFDIQVAPVSIDHIELSDVLWSRSTGPF